MGRGHCAPGAPVTDTDGQSLRGPEPVDARWAVTSAVLTTLERGVLARSGVLTTVVDGGIRVERAARRICGVLERSSRPRPALPNVHEDGPPDAPAVILVNGWTASGLVWPQALVTALARDLRVLRVDNRGTGWSRHLLRPFTIGDLADDIRRVIEERGLDRPIVAGLSMGGMITQELALRAPDHIGHAVLLATRPPSPEHTNPPAFVTARLLAPPRPGQPLQDFMRQRWQFVTGPGFPDRHPAAMGEVVRSFVRRPTTRAAVLDQARAIGAWAGAARLRRMRVPTTIVHGADDPLVPVRNGMRLAQLIPDARYVELAGVGHLVPFEAPSVVVRIVADLVAGRMAGSGRRGWD